MVVEKSRGLWGVSQCWRGVVQQQVELGGPTGRSVGPSLGGWSTEWGLAVPWEHGEGTRLYLASTEPGAMWGQLCCACRSGLAQVSAMPCAQADAAGQETGPVVGCYFLLGCCCVSVVPPQPLPSPQGCALTLAVLQQHQGPEPQGPRQLVLAGQGWGCSEGHILLQAQAFALLPQVQRFLEAAGQAPDLAERYCRLYQRLRGATEELFGQQAAFVLALGQGFAGALLQLSFLTALHVSRGSVAPVPWPWARAGELPWPTALGQALGGWCPDPPEPQSPALAPRMVPSSGLWRSFQRGPGPGTLLPLAPSAPAWECQSFPAASCRNIATARPCGHLVSPVCSQPCPLQVSEQFARYLDVQIQELRRAVGSTGPLERLQQFLEPFVVFSGLEFAHTFEHFYR